MNQWETPDGFIKLLTFVSSFQNDFFLDKTMDGSLESNSIPVLDSYLCTFG